MNRMNKLIHYILHPQKIIPYVILYASAKGCFNFLSDEYFIRIRYRTRLGKKINLDYPRKFNEKLEWLKLHDRNPVYTQMADKFLVREHVASVVGGGYLIPLLGVWDDPDAIDFDMLPEQFVLKCNHNSGRGMYICTDKSKINEKAVRKGLRRGLRENHYLTGGREWPYKNIQKKIIAEQYMADESGYELKDYKFFTFSGQVYCIEVDYDRFTNHHRNFYSREWEYLPFTILYPTNSNRKIEKPECLEEMIIIAEKLAASIGNPAFLRVDLYCIGNRIYFGELTFFHDSGEGKFYPEIYDKKLGDLISLKKFTT